MTVPADDATDCAGYIRKLRLQEQGWERFDAATQDYLARHRGVLPMSSLRQMLADAYSAMAPNDDEAINRILALS